MSEVATKDLPDGWKLCKLGDVMRLKNGYAFKSNDYSESGTPLIRISDLKDGVVNLDKAVYIPDDLANEEFLVETGDLLIAMSGATTGKIGVYKGVNPALQNQRVGNFKIIDESVVDKRYRDYYISSLRKDIEGAAYGGAQPNISSKGIEEFEFPLAPPEQQKRIVAKIEELFSHIDAGIEALKKAKQLLKQYRQSVLKAAVTGELTKNWRQANKDKLEPASQLLERINRVKVQEFSRKLAEWERELAQWKSTGEKGKKPAKPKKPKELESISKTELNSLGDLPDGWLWERLGNLTVDVFDGPFGSNLKSSDYVEKGIRVIRLENIGNLEFKNEKQSFVTSEKYELLKKHTVGSGDLIFSSFVADGTRVVVLPKTVETAINKADCFCVRCYGDTVYNKYLALFLATNSAYKRLENEVHGATRPRINTTQLKNIEVPICATEEQNEVVRILELKFDAIARLEGEIDEKLLMVDKNKQSILASAFTGVLPC